MAHAKIKLSPRKQDLIDQGRTLKGDALRIAVSIESRFLSTLMKDIDNMIKFTEREVKKLFNTDNYSISYAMDANIGSQARILTNLLYERFEDMFDKIAKPTTETMVDAVGKNSAATLKTSIKEISGNLSFNTDISTSYLQEIIAAGTAESVALIKRVPAKYLDNITTGIMNAITSGNGLQDIIPLLEKQKVQVKNWAGNVAMDQTRKIYNNMNHERMKAVGITKYEWIHSGGSNQPRLYHKNILNHQIFEIDDPPIIDEKSGERGIPGQAINCRCTMRPVIELGA